MGLLATVHCLPPVGLRLGDRAQEVVAPAACFPAPWSICMRRTGANRSGTEGGKLGPLERSLRILDKLLSHMTFYKLGCVSVTLQPCAETHQKC